MSDEMMAGVENKRLVHSSIQLLRKNLAREPPESRVTLCYRKQINNLSPRTNVLLTRVQVAIRLA